MRIVFAGMQFAIHLRTVLDLIQFMNGQVGSPTSTVSAEVTAESPTAHTLLDICHSPQLAVRFVLA